MAGGYGGQYSEPVAVSRVLFVGAAELQAGGASMAEGVKGVLYVDAANSEPPIEIKQGAQVEARGARLIADSVQAFRGPGGAVHHWEAVLR